MTLVPDEAQMTVPTPGGASPENAADLMATVLAESGVKRIFGYPGDPIIEFMERSRRRGVEVVLAAREAGAGFMAEGLSMATGDLGVCLSTLGPGSTALLNPVAAANLDRVPMLAISGQIETSRQATFTHQVVDHGRLYAPVTKWAASLEAVAAQVTMRKALRVATAERPGAVHLSVSADNFQAPVGTQYADVPPMRAAATGISVLRAPGAPDPRRLLASARRPILLAGIGAVRSRAGDSVRGLAAAVGMPVIVAPMAKGIVPEDDDWFAGVLDMACGDVVWDIIAGSDLVIAAGFDAVELIKPWSVDTPVMHVDALANTDQIYASPVEVVGDVANSLDWFASEWTGEERWSAEEVAALRRRVRDGYYAGRVKGALNPTDVVDIARANASLGEIVTSDVGSHKLLIGQGWRADTPRSVLMTNGLSSMGFGIPAAIGAALAQPDRPVMALVGDGGFAMAATELRIAATYGLGIRVIVFVDGSLNRIELKQMAIDYPSTATRIEDSNVAAMAEAMGCDGVRVSSAGELEATLAGSTSPSRPLVVEAHIDPTQYESQFS